MARCEWPLSATAFFMYFLLYGSARTLLYVCEHAGHEVFLKCVCGIPIHPRIDPGRAVPFFHPKSLPQDLTFDLIAEPVQLSVCFW